MKYKFSREWHEAEIDIRYYDEINKWCSENLVRTPHILMHGVVGGTVMKIVSYLETRKIICCLY